MLRKKYFKVVFYIYLGIVLYLTLSPADKIRLSFLERFLFPGADKIVHLSLFAILLLLFRLSYKKNHLFSFLIFSFLGILIEFLQHILPTHRSFELMDWGYDMMGILLGILVCQTRYFNNFLNKLA